VISPQTSASQKPNVFLKNKVLQKPTKGQTPTGQNLTIC
jgi:hypothetical protein